MYYAAFALALIRSITLRIQSQTERSVKISMMLLLSVKGSSCNIEKSFINTIVNDVFNNLVHNVNNDFVIPADITTFFDDTVEPGVQYYYNFTVVKTDFSESTPSGKINLMSLDTRAPGIYHSPIRNAFTASNLVISATVADNLMLREVKLFYRTTGTDEWNIANMTNHNDRWSAVIAADALSTDGLEYYIRAFDGVNYTCSGSELDPYSVTIQLAIDASAKGDVNGDGVITNIDALMLLQAANDMLNLTPEQFLRADLNEDGELSAAEALRILKYANGSITTLIG